MKWSHLTTRENIRIYPFIDTFRYLSHHASPQNLRKAHLKNWGAYQPLHVSNNVSTVVRASVPSPRLTLRSSHQFI